MSEKSSKLCNVDLLRGLAAIAILLWHYQHFYYPAAGVQVDGWRADSQPMFAYFKWLYLHGDLAVQFFWTLSGFIFFHVYADRQRVTAREFFSYRFSRLYPLHFLTLCLVALLQGVSWTWLEKFQIYALNDVYHFFLNLFLASHWGFEKGFSFNGPIWSISVEVLAYLVFFVYLTRWGVSFLGACAALALALIIYKLLPGPIAACIAFFFLGGFVQQFAELVRKRGRWVNVACATLASCGLVAALALGYIAPAQAPWALFPVLVWTAAALDQTRLSAGRVGLALGKISYSSYLIHIPIQMTAMIALDAWVGSRVMVESSVFLLGYVTTVLMLSVLAYRCVERPGQDMLRRYLGVVPRAVSAAPAA